MNRMVGSIAKRRARLWLLIPLILLMQGCYIRVFTDIGGNVGALLVAESRISLCDPICDYELEAGDNFDTVFVAQPSLGYQFVGWVDSFTDNVSACPNVTNPECRLTLQPVPEGLEGFGLELRPRFAQYNGLHFNRLAFSRADIGGVLVQVDKSRWLEVYFNGATYEHVTVSRSPDSIGLRDNNRGLITVINFQTRKILQGKINEQPLEFATLGPASGTVTGFLVVELTLNNPYGLHIADLSFQGDEDWLYEDPRGKQEDMTLKEVDRTESELVLRNEADGYNLVISLAEGQVQMLEGQEPSLYGYVRSSSVEVTGWNVAEVEYADMDSGETLGFLRQTGFNRWADFDPLNGGQRSEYQQDSRDANRVLLTDLGTGSTYEIYLPTGQVRRPSFIGSAAVPLWDIVKASTAN